MVKRPIVDRTQTLEMQQALAREIAELQATARREGERASAVLSAIGNATKLLKQNARRSVGVPNEVNVDPLRVTDDVGLHGAGSSNHAGPPRLTLLLGGAGDEGGIESSHIHSSDHPSDPSLVSRNDHGAGLPAAMTQDDTFQGTVRLQVVNSGSARTVVEFLNALWLQPAIRVHRCSNGSTSHITEVLLELRQPVILEQLFAALPCVVAATTEANPGGATGPTLVRITLQDRPLAAAVS